MFSVQPQKIPRIYYITATSEEEMSDWIDAIDNAGSSTIGTPYNISHNIHVDFDSNAGFSGMPKEWECMLQSSGITKSEVLSNIGFSVGGAKGIQNFREKIR